MRKQNKYTEPLRSGKILVGMDAIGDYYGRDVKTIKHLIENDNFPATMVCGRWVSHTDLIDDYQKLRIMEESGFMSTAS